ncbi:hypothetical protein DSL72_003398 [Monilinia vaccinii-corymbosi]|uniref:Major facilitator superfamily (MFS) profile domain-containing protein n=1 Tax=Monilinia vaccinii-corymbosi TaxID=61207 RepID=A0A8A3NWR3_9HELO|nr:hypothetical protein DSL72_003398 [Monilinia vaccinii-corymbosi]
MAEKSRRSSIDTSNICYMESEEKPPVQKMKIKPDGVDDIEEAADITTKAAGISDAVHLVKNKDGIRHESLPITNLDANIVGGESQHDPKMPFNFLALRKWVCGWANLHCPSFGDIWALDVRLAPNTETLIVCRFFSGVGGAAALTLGGSIIGDLFCPEQRGFAMGMWNIGPLNGPIIGPLLGGFLVQKIGWRYDFWIVFAAVTPVTALIAIFKTETSHKVLVQRETIRLRKELGRDGLKSCYDDSGDQSTAQIVLVGLIRPLKLLVLSPLVLLLSLYIAFVSGVVYLLYTTIPTVFQNTYGFTAGETGLVYLALGLGNILRWLAVTLYSDKLVVRLAQANDGVFVPEMRLASSIYMGESSSPSP